MPKLNKDIRSYSKPEHCYGIKGEEVTIIRHSGKTCLVENAKRDRYAVLLENLIDIPVEIKTEAAPDTAAPSKPIINRAPVSRLGKKPKAAPINQTNLF